MEAATARKIERRGFRAANSNYELVLYPTNIPNPSRSNVLGTDRTLYQQLVKRSSSAYIPGFDAPRILSLLLKPHYTYLNRSSSSNRPHFLHDVILGLLLWYRV